MEETIVVLPRSAPYLLHRVDGFERNFSIIPAHHLQETYHWTTQTVADGSIQFIGPFETSVNLPYSWMKSPQKALKTYETARDAILPHVFSSVPSRPITSTVPTVPSGTMPPTTRSIPALNEPQPPAEEQHEILVNLWGQREPAVQDGSPLQTFNVRNLLGDTEPSLPRDISRPTGESFLPEIALAAPSARESGKQEPQPFAPAIGGADHRSGASLERKDDHHGTQTRPASPETDWETIRSSRENSYMSEMLEEMELECSRSEYGDNKAVTLDDSAQERLRSALKRNRDSISRDSYGDPEGGSVKRGLTIHSSQTPSEMQPQLSLEEPKHELSEEFLFIAKRRNPYTPVYMTWPQVYQSYQEKFREICGENTLKNRYSKTLARARKQGHSRRSIWGRLFSPTTTPRQESPLHEQASLEPRQLKTEQGGSDVVLSVGQISERGCLAPDGLGESHLESGNEHPGSETSGWTKQVMSLEEEPVPTILGSMRGLRRMPVEVRRKLSEEVNGRRKCPLCRHFKASSDVKRLSSKTDRFVCSPCARREIWEEEAE